MIGFFAKHSVELYKSQDFGDLVLRRFSFGDDSLLASSHVLVDFGRVVRHAAKWRQKFPKIELVYNAGFNPDHAILKFLTSIGFKLTVSSGTELETVLGYEIGSESLFYGGLCKINRHIKLAAFNGVNVVTFTSERELGRIAKLHPGASLCYRVDVFGHDFLDEYTPCDMIFENIEGILNVYERAKELGVTIRGLQIDLHKSDVCDCSEKCFLTIKSLLSIAESCAMPVEFVNFGSNAIVESLMSKENDEFAKELNIFCTANPKIQFYAEPNRYIVGSSSLVCCAVVGIRHVKKNGVDSMFYYLNDGLYGSFSKSVYYSKNYRPIPFMRNAENRKRDLTSTLDAIMWGPTCDSMDKVCELTDYPILAVGDVVVFDTFGCQSPSGATNFNGFSLPKPVYAFCVDDIDRYPDFSSLFADLCPNISLPR